MTRPLSDLDVSLPAVEARARLGALTANPPAGHTPQMQPRDYYEEAFDLLACAHPDTCTCPPKERP